jgi:hypothetical protein
MAATSRPEKSAPSPSPNAGDHAGYATPSTSGKRRYITLFALAVLGGVLQYNRSVYLQPRQDPICQGTVYDNWENLKPERIPRKPSYLIEATTGAVASDNIICSEVGVEILKNGGNAVDSAIATTLCIGVVNMFSYVAPFARNFAPSH